MAAMVPAWIEHASGALSMRKTASEGSRPDMNPNCDGETTQAAASDDERLSMAPAVLAQVFVPWSR